MFATFIRHSHVFMNARTFFAISVQAGAIQWHWMEVSRFAKLTVHKISAKHDMPGIAAWTALIVPAIKTAC